METELKTDATKDLASIKATIDSDELKVKTEAKSIWTRFEPYLCAFVGLVVGVCVDHFIK